MILTIVGNVNPDEILNLVKENQSKKEFREITNIKREYKCEDSQVVRPYAEVKMDILMPKVAIGLKLPYEGLTGEELLKQELLLKILMEETFGSTSDNYQEMLDL